MIPLSDGKAEAVSNKGDSHDACYPLAAVWEEILAGIFSIIGRMEGLARCFDSTGIYTWPELPTGADYLELDAAIRAIHVLVWKDWLSGSLERQQTDLLVYASEAFETVDVFLEAWQSARPYSLSLQNPQHRRNGRSLSAISRSSSIGFAISTAAIIMNYSLPQRLHPLFSAYSRKLRWPMWTPISRSRLLAVCSASRSGT